MRKKIKTLRNYFEKFCCTVEIKFLLKVGWLVLKTKIYTSSLFSNLNHTQKDNYLVPNYCFISRKVLNVH